jgi:hypothetical protein
VIAVRRDTLMCEVNGRRNGGLSEKELSDCGSQVCLVRGQCLRQKVGSLKRYIWWEWTETVLHIKSFAHTDTLKWTYSAGNKFGYWRAEGRTCIALRASPALTYWLLLTMSLNTAFKSESRGRRLVFYTAVCRDSHVNIRTSVSVPVT